MPCKRPTPAGTPCPHRSGKSSRTLAVSGGGLVTAALHPAEGAEQIAHYAVHIARTVPGLTLLERTVNGQPGLVAQQDGVIVTVFASQATASGTSGQLRNPGKLRPWTTG
jgi:RNA polymerase sigma-70 factor, ECF subfamily